MSVKLTSFLLAGLALAGLSTATYAQEKWLDCVTINGGTYTITTGYWTENGTVIGTTWTGGGSITGVGTTYSMITFPAGGPQPNDWHYGTDPTDPTNPNAPNPVPDTYDDGAGNVTEISHWSDWGPWQGQVIIPIFVGSVPLTEIVQSYDFTGNSSDPILVLDLNGGVVHNGPLSAFNPVSFGLTQVGTRVARPEDIIPAASDVGLIVLAGMVLAAGVIVVRRGRRMATA